MKMTIKQYAENEGTTVQSVYAKIKRGTLNSIEENGIKYVIDEPKSIKRDDEQPLKEAFKIIKRLQKENKLLRADLRACNKSKDKVHRYIIDKYENALPAPKNDDAIDVEIKPKKSKKKKK